MPRIEIELDEKGEIVGQAPTELSAIFERIGKTEYGRGLGKGHQQAAEDAKKQIDDNVKAELAKRSVDDVIERDKHQRTSEENEALKGSLTDKVKEHDKVLRAREESHAKEIMDRADALQKRNAKITSLVTANLRALAAQAGARDESLSELEVILRHRIGFDDDMEPFVKTEDGSGPHLVHGKPIALDVFVKQYIDNHPHHRKPLPGRGGDARGGASLRSTVTHPQSIEAARAAMDAGDRSPEAINALFNAGRKQPVG